MALVLLTMRPSGSCWIAQLASRYCDLAATPSIKRAPTEADVYEKARRRVRHLEEGAWVMAHNDTPQELVDQVKAALRDMRNSTVLEGLTAEQIQGSA
jgi:hypothetical protein